jgi:hypothetical protein
MEQMDFDKTPASHRLTGIPTDFFHTKTMHYPCKYTPPTPLLALMSTLPLPNLWHHRQQDHHDGPLRKKSKTDATPGPERASFDEADEKDRELTRLIDTHNTEGQSNIEQIIHLLQTMPKNSFSGTGWREYNALAALALAADPLLLKAVTPFVSAIDFFANRLLLGPNLHDDQRRPIELARDAGNTIFLGWASEVFARDFGQRHRGIDNMIREVEASGRAADA